MAIGIHHVHVKTRDPKQTLQFYVENLGATLIVDRGLGYVILSATSYWKTELAFSSMILLSLMAILLFAAVELIERLTCPWLAPAGEE